TTGADAATWLPPAREWSSGGPVRYDGPVVCRVVDLERPSVSHSDPRVTSAARVPPRGAGAPDEGPHVPSVAEERAGRPGCPSPRQGLRDQHAGSPVQGPPGLSDPGTDRVRAPTRARHRFAGGGPSSSFRGCLWTGLGTRCGGAGEDRKR